MYAYPAGNAEFRAARDNCAKACREYNDQAEQCTPQQRGAMWLKIVSPGSKDIDVVTGDQQYSDPSIQPQIPFVKGPIFMDYGLRVRIGGTTFINRGCKILDTPVADVIIGERCLLGPNVTIVSVGHPLRAEARNEALTGRPASFGQLVLVGDDVWIGAGVTIMPGVKIGSKSVIGAGSVVTKDIPPQSLAYGVPAEVKRDLTNAKPPKYDGVAQTLEEALGL